MKKISLFLRTNLFVLLGIVFGAILGYLYWYHFACYWGAYPLSAEWWVNTIFGAIIGGFIIAIFVEHPNENEAR